MSVLTVLKNAQPGPRPIFAALTLGLLGAGLAYPGFVLDTATHVFWGFVHVLPLVIPGIALAAWITASGASDWVAAVFEGRLLRTIVAATLFGALLPVCGVTVLPLMAGLLAAGVPLAPVMAFWLASPITGPAMLAATAGTLGWEYAIGKALAAIGLGLFGGVMTALFAGRGWAKSPLRSSRILGSLNAGCGGCGASDTAFEPRIWQSETRRARFVKDSVSISRLIVIVLIPAFAAEHLLNALLAPDAVAAYVGNGSIWAVPLAVIVGGPAYIDGYAALPLTRALLDAGMSHAAGMAFLVSGGVVSVWGAMAIFPVLRWQAFSLYLALAAIGSMLAGWGFGAFTG